MNDSARTRLRRIARLAILSFLVCAGAARADYRVDVSAPAPFRALLTQNLEIVKAASRRGLKREEFERLYAQTGDRIRVLMETQGYFSARVEASLKPERGGLAAAFRVTPGAPTHVAQVSIRFTGAIRDAREGLTPARLRADWPLRPGALFRAAQWEDAKRAVLTRLLTEGYPAARLRESEARVDPTRASADLSLLVDSGPRFYFGGLVIKGLSRYPARVIADVNPIRPGEPYSQEALLKLRSRVERSGYFSSVGVFVNPDPAQAAAVPVTVKVVERQRKRVAIGAGYSTDTRERGKIEYDDLNLFGRPWRFKTGVEADRFSSTVTAGVALPMHPNGDQDSVNATYARRSLSGELTRAGRLAFTRERKETHWDRAITTEYQDERSEVLGAPSARDRALSLNVSWSWQHVDNLFFPTRGYFLNAQLGGASSHLLSDRSFVRVYTRALAYTPLGARDVLLWRFEGGLVNATDRHGIPSEFLFRTGGDRSIRGYAYQSIGTPEGDAIVGGRYLLVASSEYDHWFTHRWGGAVFYDTGDATDSLTDVKFFPGYGVGARYRSPVGAVQLDLAYGQRVGRVRLHFAVGVTF